MCQETSSVSRIVYIYIYISRSYNRTSLRGKCVIVKYRIRGRITGEKGKGRRIRIEYIRRLSRTPVNRAQLENTYGILFTYAYTDATALFPRTTRSFDACLILREELIPLPCN